jgi:hypothetical protein
VHVIALHTHAHTAHTAHTHTRLHTFAPVRSGQAIA